MVRPGLGERLAGGGGGPGQHDGRLGAGDGGGDDPGAGGEAVALADLPGADGDEGGAVHDAGGVARVVDVVDLLDPVVLLQRHGVEAAQLADPGEGGLQRGERVGGGAGAHVLVVVEDGEPVTVEDGDHRALEAALLPGGGGPLLGQRGELVDVPPLKPAEGGDEVGADALRGEAGLEAGHRVHGPGAAVRAHRHPGHRLDAAGEDQVLPARTDLGRGQVDSFETGRAEAVLLYARDGVGQSRGDGGDPRDVGALVPDRADDTEHDVVDGRGVESGKAGAHLMDQADDEVDRLGAVQGAVGLAATARGADRVVEIRFGAHDSCLSKWRYGSGGSAGRFLRGACRAASAGVDARHVPVAGDRRRCRRPGCAGARAHGGGRGGEARRRGRLDDARRGR